MEKIQEINIEGTEAVSVPTGMVHLATIAEIARSIAVLAPKEIDDNKHMILAVDILAYLHALTDGVIDCTEILAYLMRTINGW